MLPRELKPEQFSSYPPEARKLGIEYIVTMQRLPLSFLPSLLREVIDYDFKFPAERKSVEKELANLRSLSAGQLHEWFEGFERIRLSPELEQFNWAGAPAQFLEQLSAYLWTTHQVDAFRTAAIQYADRLSTAVPPEPPLIPRLGIAVIGQGVQATEEPIFRKLKPHGTYFTNVKPDNGIAQLLKVVGTRAQAHPGEFAHWYVDGGAAADYGAGVTGVSYQGLEPARQALSAKLKAEIERPGMGPEALRSLMAQLRPAELGLNSSGPVLDRFQLKLLTEGSGTQIFSTTFAQWTARETLRRAQPVTLLVRFAPRQRQKPMNELLAGSADAGDLDYAGSLVDADLGAYYTWINQQRLPGADQSSFLVWFENHGEAVAIGPAMSRGAQSNAPIELREVIASMA
jgi:hypothetical protein